MPLMIVPDDFSTRLAAAGGPVELCASDGKFLGYFTPGPAKKYNFDPGVSEEELDRAEASGPGRPLLDIILDFKARGRK